MKNLRSVNNHSDQSFMCAYWDIYHYFSRQSMNLISLIRVWCALNGLYYRTCNIVIEPIDGKTNKMMSNCYCEFEVWQTGLISVFAESNDGGFVRQRL